MSQRNGAVHAFGGLKTTAVGSMSAPGWLSHLRANAAHESSIGPADLAEAARDATRIAVLDQEAAGLDEIGSGEVYIPGGFLGQYFDALGIPLQPVERRLGPFGYDQMPKRRLTEAFSPETTLGAVQTWTAARSFASRPVKATVAGPITLAMPLEVASGYPSRSAAVLSLADLVNRELKALVQAGATHVQIDEPTMARDQDPGLAVEAAQRALAGIDVAVSIHICFGDNQGRPFAWRRYDPLVRELVKIPAEEWVLEFANREMAEAELWSSWLDQAGRHLFLAAGVIDVKSSYIETADDVAWRVETLLRHVPAEDLSLTTDCGFSQTPRWQALRKLSALVEGVRKAAAGVL